MLSFVVVVAWGIGQVIFLGVFFAVVAIILVTVAASALQTILAIRTNTADAIRWKSDFHDLHEASRTCRHEFTGEFAHRICTNNFDCNACEQHAKLGANRYVAAPVTVQMNQGFTLPTDRLYHRGHTWTKRDPDGTYVIGIDDFASRLIGTPGSIELPAIGTRLSINSSAWNVMKGNTRVRLLSPIEGEVVETSDGAQGWYVRVKPVSAVVKTEHLLRGPEVGPWIQREFERLQNFLSDPQIGYTLPDGGAPIKDFSAEFPGKDWECIYSSLLLEP